MDELSDEIDIHAEVQTQILALPGKKFPLKFLDGEFTVAEVPVFIKEQSNSVVLAKYLEHVKLDMSGLTVLELGSGTGVVGIAASVLGARRTYVTDLAYALPNALENIALNRAELKNGIHAVELDWMAPQKTTVPLSEVDLVLAADVIWIDELIEPLATTISHILRTAAPSCRVLIAHQTRSYSADKHFFAAILEQHVQWKKIAREEHHPTFQDKDIEIFELRLEVVCT